MGGYAIIAAFLALENLVIKIVAAIIPDGGARG